MTMNESTSGAAAIATELAHCWEASSPSVIPCALQLYQLGQVLVQLSPQKSHDLQCAYRNLVTCMSAEDRARVFQDLWNAFMSIFVLKEEEENQKDINDHTQHTALDAVWQLVQADINTFQYVNWTLDELTSLIARDGTVQQQAAVFCIIPALLLHAPLELVLSSIQLLQEQQHDNGDVWDAFLDSISDAWRRQILEKCIDPTQKDYLSNLLQPSNNSDEPIRLLQPEKQNAGASSSFQQKETSSQEELQRRIDQVRDVLPDLGEGFVETALACYEGNIERTIQALLDDATLLPGSLQYVDRDLPRRRLQDDKRRDALEQAEANAATKVALAAVERRNQPEALALTRVMVADEYADDYDDQYDNEHTYIADAGLYDNYDNIRTYNQALKQVEQEQSFWEENQNTNQSLASAGIGGGGKERDRLKGGRFPGRSGVGRGEKAKGSSGEASTKPVGGAAKPVNKRQKEANLAKRREKQKQSVAKQSGA
jgi:hypothetical protein